MPHLLRDMPQFLFSFLPDHQINSMNINELKNWLENCFLTPFPRIR